MNIKSICKKIRKLFTVDLKSAGVDTRYAAEIKTIHEIAQDGYRAAVEK